MQKLQRNLTDTLERLLPRERGPRLMRESEREGVRMEDSGIWGERDRKWMTVEMIDAKQNQKCVRKGERCLVLCRVQVDWASPHSAFALWQFFGIIVSKWRHPEAKEQNNPSPPPALPRRDPPPSPLVWRHRWLRCTLQKMITKPRWWLSFFFKSFSKNKCLFLIVPTQ